MQLTLGSGIGQLQVEASGVADESRVLGVDGQIFGLELGIDANAATRERDHRQAMLRQKRLECGGFVTKLRQRAGPQLDAFEADGSDVLDGLLVLALPCNGGIAEPKVGGCLGEDWPQSRQC